MIEIDELITQIFISCGRVYLDFRHVYPFLTEVGQFIDTVLERSPLTWPTLFITNTQSGQKPENVHLDHTERK